MKAISYLAWLSAAAVCGSVSAQVRPLTETNPARPPTRLFTNANGQIGVIYGTAPSTVATGTVGGVQSAPARLFTNTDGSLGVVSPVPANGATSAGNAPLNPTPATRLFTNSDGRVGVLLGGSQPMGGTASVPGSPAFTR